MSEKLEEILESILMEMELSNNFRWLEYEKNNDGVGLANWVKEFRKRKPVGLKEPDLEFDVRGEKSLGDSVAYSINKTELKKNIRGEK